VTRAEYNLNLGRSMRAKRMRFDLRQADLALLLGVSESSVSNWETGCGMNAYTRFRIGVLFNKTPEQIKALLAEKSVNA
jgi:DNA-binding XRE family transcriptional regulator